MTPKRVPRRAIEKGKYKLYLSKAQDFYRAMERSLNDGNWTAAGLEAVHCAISATDALLAYAGGARSLSWHNCPDPRLRIGPARASPVPRLPPLGVLPLNTEYPSRSTRAGRVPVVARD